MKQDKILLGGVAVVSIVGIVVSLTHLQSVEEVIVEKVEELSELEVLVEEVKNSDAFQKETNLRAEARAMYQLSTYKQSEALELSEKALATYRMAMELENEWKVNQVTE